MTTHRSVPRSLYFATAVLFLLGLSPRSFGGDTPRPVLSLTAAERAHLSDDTRVTIPWRGTVTLGQLRAEHRARLERFSRAGLWGKRVADKMPKPTPVTATKASSQLPAGSKAVSNGPVQNQNSSAPGQSAAIQNTPGVTKTSVIQSGQQQKSSGSVLVQGAGQNALAKTSATQTAPRQSGSTNAGGGNGQNVLMGGAQLSGPVSSNPMLPSKVAGSSAISSNLFLVPRLADPKVPTPVDYLAFCNAAQASACIYLPPNTTFLIPQGPPDPTGAHALDGIGNQATGVDADTYVWDVDPMITDAGVCSSLGGRLTQDNACYFAYFSFQETTYKPAGKPSSAVSCGGDLYYWFFPNQGRIEALYNLPLTLGLSTISTGATPATCVVQVWLYP